MKKLSRNLMIFVLSIAIILSSLSVAKFDVNAASASFDTTHEFYLVSVQYPTKSVNVYVDKTSDIQNKTAVNLYATDKSATQRFKFVKNSKGNYLICPTGSNYTVNVSALSAGTAVFTWENKAANNEYFIIESAGNGNYTLRMENSTSLYLTATSSSALSLKAKTSGNTQLFKIVDYTAEKAGSSSTSVSDTVNQVVTDAQNALLGINTKSYYNIVSAAYPSKSINMNCYERSEIKNKTAVNLYKTDDSETQLFTLSKNSKGNFLIVPYKTKYTVNIGARKAGTSVFAWKNASANNEYFKIESAGDGYVRLRLQSKTSLYLTASSSSKLTLKTKVSGKSQLFKFVDKTVQKDTADAAQAAADAAQNADFRPRLTAPAANNKYYLKKGKGGVNECILITGKSCIPNCVGYAWGRAYEITGKKPKLAKTDACSWWGYNKSRKYYKYGSEPKVGAIVCWGGNKISSAGHVAVVEKISGNKVTISESNYKGKRFVTVTYSKNGIKNRLKKKDGSRSFQGYIYVR